MFIVRLKENKEFVGVWAAISIYNLWHAVDECVSPTVCEYFKIKEGGLMALERCEFKIRIGEDIPNEESATPEELDEYYTEKAVVLSFSENLSFLKPNWKDFPSFQEMNKLG